jgi:hypothetical protein
MAIGISNNCPICWDDIETMCRCTEKQKEDFEKELKLKRKMRFDEKRREYHELLDLCYDKFSPEKEYFLNKSFVEYFVGYLMRLYFDREKWLKLKEGFDDFFKIL